MTRGRLLVAVVVAAAVLGTGLAAWSAASTGARPSGPIGGALLPDLDPVAPNGLVVQVALTEAGKRFRLGFASATENLGAGPLVVRGRRERLSQTEMAAEQVIQLVTGATSVRPDVGAFVYVDEVTHEHWHLLPFMRYELRRSRDFALVVPDRKTGFCLGDRYEADATVTLPGEPAERVYNTSCGPEQTELLELEEGISVGWGDVYEAWRDQQFVDVTGLAAGRYVLVHRVNQGRLLAESRYANNASSVVIELTWPRGLDRKPRVRLLASCAGKARCTAPRGS